MKKPIYYYQNVPHFDDYNVGEGRCPCPPAPRPPHPPCPPPPPPRPYYHGKVGIIGRTVLTVRYIDHHGHVQVFDIQDGETYEIKAVSQTRGICTFAGRIIDFECTKGIEKLINKPHEIDVTAIIVDYSDAYESKLLRIGIENIISIKPIRCFDSNNDLDYLPLQPHPPIKEPRFNPKGFDDEYHIKDPFEYDK